MERIVLLAAVALLLIGLISRSAMSRPQAESSDRYLRIRGSMTALAVLSGITIVVLLLMSPLFWRDALNEPGKAEMPSEHVYVADSVGTVLFDTDGWISPNAIFIDQHQTVWIEAAALVFPEYAEATPIHVERVDGVGIVVDISALSSTYQWVPREKMPDEIVQVMGGITNASHYARMGLLRVQEVTGS